MPTTVLRAPPDFQTLRRPWNVNRILAKIEFHKIFPCPDSWSFHTLERILKKESSFKKWGLLKKYASKDYKKFSLNDNLAVLQYKLFESIAEESLVEPTFIIDYPVEVSPLARVSDTNKEITERFELYIGGREIANGFSELNDPEDQARRFNLQAEVKAGGDDEAMHYDEEYIRALESRF